MTDREFKILNHRAKGFEDFSDGKQIQKYFSPDFVLKNSDEYILIEHETEPNRKQLWQMFSKRPIFFRKKIQAHWLL